MYRIDIKDDYSERVKYDYSEYPIYIRKGALSSFPNYAAESHWHEDIELIVVESGEMQYNINGEIVALHRNEGIIVNAKQLHHGFSLRKSECEYICILFHPILMCITKSIENDYVSGILASGIPYFRLSPDTEWQKDIMEDIRDIWKKRNVAVAPLYAQGKLCLLWSKLLSETEKISSAHPADDKLATLKNMIGCIHKRYDEKITLADIAKAGYVSKRTCGMIFRAYQNQTPIEFLNDYRLRKSIELMNNAELTILDIALSVGFSGASYYAESFRRRFGVSPTQYRKIKQE